jgi:tRNA(adenine34) deaminase
MMDITEKMRLTLSLAREAMSAGECPIAAVVFLDDEIIAQSWTKEFSERRLLVHAELNALTDADIKRYPFKDRKRMQLFTNLEPCMVCLGAAMSSFIGEVYFALESPSDGAVGMARAWNPEITSGILREESKALLAAFPAAYRSRRGQGAHSFLLCCRPA